MWRAIASLLLIITAPVMAEPVWLNLGGVSWHPGADGRNGRNPGIGLELGLNDRRFIATGLYRNSYDMTSHYLVHGWRPYDSGTISGGIVAGLVDGYARRDGRIIPLAAPFVSIEGDTAALAIIVKPKAEKRGAATVAAQLKIKIQ